MILSVYPKRSLTLQCKKEDKNIQLDGYNLLNANYPSNSKRGGVCIFYKETLGVCIVKSLTFSEYIFVKSLYKIARIMLVLYIGLQAKIVLNLKIFVKF